MQRRWTIHNEMQTPQPQCQCQCLLGTADGADLVSTDAHQLLRNGIWTSGCTRHDQQDIDDSVSSKLSCGRIGRLPQTYASQPWRRSRYTNYWRPTLCAGMRNETTSIQSK